MEQQLTRQGVRDLSVLASPRVVSPEARPMPFLGSFQRCKHPNAQRCVRECCGDFYCDDCGLVWDAV